MPRRLPPLLAASMVACGPSPINVDVAPVATAETFLVGLEVGNATQLTELESVHALERVDGVLQGELPTIDIEENGQARVTVIGLDRRLENFALTPGLLSRGSGTPVSRHATTAHEKLLLGDEVSPWEEVTELREPLASFEIPGRRPTCECWTGETLVIDSSTTSAVVLARLNDEQLLAVHEDGRFVLLTFGEAETTWRDITPEDVDVGIGGGVLESLDPDTGDASLIIGGRRAELWRVHYRNGEIETPFELIANLSDITSPDHAPEPGEGPALESLRWFALHEGSAYILSVGTSLLRVDLATGDATHLEDVADEPRRRGSYVHGGVLVTREGHVLAASAESPRLAWLDARSQTVRRIDTLQAAGLAAIAESEDGRLFVGTSITPAIIVVEPQAGALVTQGVCESQLGNSVGSLIPFSDGFLAGSTQGFVEQYSTEVGWCEKLQVGTGGIRFTARFGPTEGLARGFVTSGPLSEEIGQVYPTLSVLRLAPLEACDTNRNPGGDPLPASCEL